MKYWHSWLLLKNLRKPFSVITSCVNISWRGWVFWHRKAARKLTTSQFLMENSNVQIFGSMDVKITLDFWSYGEFNLFFSHWEPHFSLIQPNVKTMVVVLYWAVISGAMTTLLTVLEMSMSWGIFSFFELVLTHRIWQIRPLSMSEILAFVA